MKSVLITVAILLLTACATTPEADGQETLLFNPTLTSSGLEVSVMSNGCTKAEHFYLRVEGQEIELRRTEADRCRRAPALVRLSFSYSFGAEVYQFKNSVRFSNRLMR